MENLLISLIVASYNFSRFGCISNLESSPLAKFILFCCASECPLPLDSLAFVFFGQWILACMTWTWTVFRQFCLFCAVSWDYALTGLFKTSGKTVQTICQLANNELYDYTYKRLESLHNQARFKELIYDSARIHVDSWAKYMYIFNAFNVVWVVT